MEIKDKALAVISVIATPDIAMDDEKKLEVIYSMAHAALGTCPNPHTDTLEEIESSYDQFKEVGLL